jgi:archaemetzincin
VNALSLVALGEVDARTIALVGEALWRVFGVEARTLPALPDPAEARDGARGQYHSARILGTLLSAAPGRILGITDRDLFIPMLSFVFGHAQFKGRAAVVSLSRLRQGFYRLPERPELTESRVVKEAVHEIGHTYGLTHCPNPSCPMSLSNTIFQVDAKTEELCHSCSILLEQALFEDHDRTSLLTENEP